MVTSPLNRNRVYKIVAIALCITLVATLSPPQGWTLLFGVGAAHAAPSLLPTQAMQAALPEMVGPLAGMSTLDPNDIIDMGALRAAAQKEAAAPASPISVSRVQSAYVASDAVSGTLVVTFTVSNNHAPAIAPPQPPPAATITDAVNAVAAVDFSQDPNVIHNVLLVDSLTSHATFVSSSPWPDRRQAQYAWNLGDIPPLGRITATLALSVPASVAAFVELDTGASAWGTLQGRAVSASTTPASLAPDGFGDWLKWTVDADYYDEYAVAKAAELGNDWEQMFGYVRSLGYESYKGSLRGTRGTLWSEAGNSLDQASLLIAMLRGSGVPARYRHGTLDTPRAQELIASMFPGTPATAGYVPPGVDTANPPEDPTLLDETRDHWWVQAYVNGTWTDLDPCFANAGPGETFYASLAANGTDQVAEAPDALRHKVTFTVKIETYHPLNTGYSGLEYGYPLSRTFNAVELVGNPATLQHLVQTDVRTGFVFYTVQHVYTPYLVVDSHAQAIEGNSFQDLVSNFPFGTMLVTAEWLMVDLRDASGKVETHVREIFDSVGFERRQAGGTLAVEQAGEPVPVVSQESYYTVLVSPSRVPASVMDAHYQKMALAAAQGQAAFATLEALGDEITNEDLPELRQARHAYGEVARVSQRLHLLLFASMSDYGADWLQDSFLVKPYAASPRLFIVSWERDQANDTDQMRFDLRKDAVRTVLYPGQTWQGLVAFNYARGVLEASLESALMEQLTGEQAISVASVFREASQQGIRLEKVSAMNLGVLDRLEISDEAKARITEALEKHQCFVLVPERSVTVGGQDTVGWFLIDIINGHTLDVMENGQHQAIVEYDLLFQGSHQEYLMALIGFFHGFAAYGIAFLAKLMAKMPFNDIDRKQAYGEAFQEASDVIDQIGQAMTDAWSTFEDCSFVDNDVVGSMAGATDAYVNGVGFSASFSVKISVTLFETPGFVDCLNSLGADLPTGTVEQSFVEVEFEFKMGGLINGAALAQAKIASWLDPPLPKSLMAYATPSRRAPAYAQGTLWAAQSLQGNEIYAALTSNASQARGTLAARWVAGSQAALEFTQLAAPIAALYAPDGTALGSGAVQVDPLQSRATATLAELPITYVLTGEGSNSFYAPALPQLGAGSNWLNGLLRLNSSQSYTVTVYRALATLDGSRVCTGTFSMVVPGAAAAVSVQVAGHTAAPNLAAQARIQAQPADLTLGPAAGIVTLDGVALDASNGLALAGYTGPMTVTPSTPAADLVELNGTASLFSLAVSPTLVLAAPHTPASVRASILANLSDNYTLTVEGPLDWSLAVDHAGQITALSPLGAAPGDYAFRLTAQSHAHPALTLSTAYTVRTSAQHGLELGVQPDPTFTVPTGPLAPGADPDSINNGQVQLPGAAYTLDITNTSTTSHTFSISVSSLSLPPDWLIVSGNVGQAGTTLTLPAGGVGRIGLYISPAQLTSLPPAASYPFTVTATMGEAPSLSRQQVAAFAMPAIAFNYLEADPSLVYGSPGVSTTFDLALTNVGNAAGAFDVHVSLPITTWAGGGSYNVTLPAGESDERALVFTPTHAALGSHGNIRITSPAPGTAYTQTAYVAVQIAGPCVLRTQNTIRVAAQLGDTQLAASLQNLTLQLGRWELDESDLTLQARVVAALNDVLAHLHARYPQIDTGDLEALAAAPAVDGFCAPAAALQDDLTTIAQRHVTAAFAPGLAATLLGRPVSYTLTLRNHGTLTTTYAVTLNGLPAGWASWTSQSATLAPGSAAGLGLVITPTVFSYRRFGAQVQAVEDDFIRASATAGLNAVDAFVRLLAVTPTPSFVETGISSTTLSIRVANIANIYQQANARVQVAAPGGSQAWAGDVPLTIRTGAAATYTLSTVDTSGWAKGVYTVSVALLDGTGRLIPDGSAYAYLGVGQVLQLSHAVHPAVVLPGTVTVTTMITSRIRQTGFMGEPLHSRTAQFASTPPAQGGDSDRALSLDLSLEPASDAAPAFTWAAYAISRAGAARRVEQARSARAAQADWTASPLASADSRGPQATPGIYRLENGDPSLVYAGTWTTNTAIARASGGTVARSLAAGSVLTASFDGAWVGVGFITDVSYGHAEVFIDGASRGVIDTYSNADDVASYYYTLISGTHTLTVSVLHSKNDLSANYYVGLDYIDVWDGTLMPEGMFEQDDPRVYRSSSWVTSTNAIASGGSYHRDGYNLWFPFTGETLAYQAIASMASDQVELLVDGVSQGFFSLYNPTLITRTYAFSLTDGPHVFQVSAYRDRATLDAFTVPGAPPYWQPSVRTGIVRYEEDDPALRYNGVPYRQTATSWSMVNLGHASRGWAARSETFSDTISLSFTGTWVGVGLLTDQNAGLVRVSIDGVQQEDVDSYGRLDATVSRYYAGLSAGVHTITLTVLDQHNPFSTLNRLYLDYIDVWDGADVPQGTFEQDDPRVYRSANWASASNAAASGGTYAYNDNAAGSAWFPFTGDSLAYQAIASAAGDKVELLVDGASQGYFDLYNPALITRTYAFSLADGPHVFQVCAYRDRASVDTFSVPGAPPYWQPSVRTGIVRYEEDDPALRYNGVPYRQTATSWSMVNPGHASRGWAARSETFSDTISLSFTGTWVGVGLLTDQNAGLVRVSIDGVQQEDVDSYGRLDATVSRYYAGLSAGVHTITLTVLDQHNPFSTLNRLYLDYIDVWDGTDMPQGTFEQDDPRVYRSANWNSASNAAASGGTYAYNDNGAGSAWLPFTGETLAYQAIASTSGGKVELLVDGVSLGYFDLYNPSLITRTYAFSLAGGPHVFQVSACRERASLDTFSVPGAPPYWQPPIRAGVVRYEEDDPALRYNGVPFRQTVGTWAMVGVAKASGAYVARSETPSDTISLTFEGRWASIGVRTGTNAGMALVSIDGISYGSIDTYSALEDVTSYIYPGLPAGTHTITLTVLDDHNPGSSNNLFYLDYIDVWDGTEFAPARIEADRVSDSEGRVYFSDGWGHYNLAAASGGVYVEDTVDGANLWFLFTGDSVDYFAISRPTLSLAQVFIDNVDYGLVTATYPFALSPLAFQYTGLGAGSHVLRLHGVTNARVDAFETPTTSFVGMPMVEWYDTAPGGGTDGMVTTPAVGDLDGDGIVEIVASSSGGVLYVYRGDGMDSGSGSPLLWQHVITGSDPDAPALADLDGIPGAEIVVGSNGGLYAFRAGGTLWWHNTAIRPDWGGTAIGNLDGDDLPEIAVAAATGLHVVEPDGQLAWTYNLFNSSPPILADLTGDGALDILTAKNNVLYLFDYEQGVTPTLAWQLSFTTTLEGRGAPAVADIDGLQPGGDAGPEIAVVSNGYIHVVDASGSLLWSYATPSGTPGGVSIADTDGDGEVEIVASVQVANPGYNPGRIYVLNADGSLLWEAMARDSTSANSVSTHDFDGDGDWEIVWNGRDQGLTIYDGNNGAILYNEPAINSMTAKDFPIVADVDGDNHVEIVTGDTEGIYVVGHDAAWAPSRPIWNQYNYHVTNVADDLSVPPIEPDSWTVHNTYRTQTPVLNPAPVYSIDITHTVMSSGMAVLTDTFSLPPDTSAPAYHWHYRQYWYQAPHTIHFDARLLDLQAGEVRQVSHGTDVSYRLFSGANHIAMPPLYVEAARIVAITPSTVALDPGSTARYTVTLYNPAPDVQTYTLSVGGLPGDFAAPGSVLVVPANATLTHTLLITTPAGGELGVYNLAVYIQTGAGGTDTAPASLVLADRLGLSIAPSSRLVVYGGIVTYTLTLTNDDDAARQFGLGVAGLDAAQIALPASLALAAHQAVTVPLVVTACQPQGLYPFRVEASAALADSDLRARAEAVLTVLGEPGVELSLLPPTAVAGQASPAFFTVLVTNTGRLADGYDLSANLPAGWRYEFRANGRSLAHLDLTPYVFNAASLQLVVFPPDGVPAASYPISVTAVSSLNAGVSASDEGLVAVSPRGVTVEIMPHVTTMNPPGSSTWDVLVTNTGEQADTFALVAGGIVSSSAQFDANPVSLEAGQLTVVHMSASALDFALPETYPLAVTAYSHGDPDVWGCDTASLSFLGYEGVALSVTPALIVFTDTLEATYLLLVTNTANTGTTFALDASADPALGLALEVDVLYIPPHMTAGILLTARANMPGTYRITVSAASTTSAARDEGTATLVVVPGDELPATITGTVFEDANGNRTRDQGEAGLGGVQVSLDHAVTTTTNVSGTYVLSTTQPGRHTLIQTDLPGYTSTTANSVAITVALGGNYRVDFGDKLVEAVTCTIDTHEPDDSPAAAHSLGIGVTATLNFCDDAVDWLSFTAQAGQVYTITTWAWGARTDTILTLYDSDGSTQLAKNDNYAPAPDLSSRIVWQAAVDGACFVRVTNRDDSSGDQTDYDVRIDTAAAAPPAGLLYLPVVVKTTIPSLYLPVVLKEADSLAAP